MMKTTAVMRYFIALVFVLPVLSFIGMEWYETKMKALPELGDWRIPVRSNRIPEGLLFQCTNQYGQPVIPAQWKGKIVLVGFFFTHCPVVCPSITRHLQQVRQAFPEDASLLINMFSVDPQRDSTKQLMNYTRLFTPDTLQWNLLTGEKKMIYHLARQHFKVVATDGDGGDQDFIHSEQIVLIDQQGQIRGYYTGTSDDATRQLIIDIKKLQDE